MWRFILSAVLMEIRKGIIDAFRPRIPAPPPPHIGNADIEHIRRQIDAARPPQPPQSQRKP